MKKLTVDAINTLSDNRSVNFNLNFNYAQDESELIKFRKKYSSFPDNLREVLEEKFFITQNDCQHTEFHPCVICVTTNLKRLSRDVYDICCPSIEKNILIKGECNQWYNTEIKIFKRNMRHAGKIYRQDKTNKNKHNQFRRLRQIKCELVTRTKALYYMKKFNECGNDSSKIHGQLNIFLGINKL